MKIFIISLIAILLPATASAVALPVGEVRSLDRPIDYITEAATNFDFNGIISLSNCSGSIVHFKGQPLSSQAYVLTNGHCVTGFGGMPKPGQVHYKKSSRRNMNAYVDINQRVRVTAHTLVYATMTNTDAALYRLNQTYEDLRQKGVEAFELSDQRPLLTQDIQIVSGYWRRGFECSIENFIYELREDDWTMRDSIRYSATGCKVYGGTSGSPVILSGQRTVVGVNNTGNESGKRCTMNNPCEVDSQGKTTVLRGRGYAQQTYWFYSCLDENYQIDLALKGCELPKP